jgi:hypothetical protein
MLACVPRVFAADDQLEIRSPYLQPVEGIYVLNAQLLFTPPEAVEQSVRDGVTLNMELQIRIGHARSWWRDEVLAQLQQRYELLYHSVSQRYLVRNVNSGAQESYTTFAEAIASLQHIENLPVIDQELLPPDPRNEVSMRATVSVRPAFTTWPFATSEPRAGVRMLILYSTVTSEQSAGMSENAQ